MNHEEVSRMLSYEPETGALRWRVARGRGVGAGDVAGTVIGAGYILVRLYGHPYYAHRLAWLLKTGAWPTGQIDHINGNPSDNRLSNLRDVTNAENSRNSKMKSNNSSGAAGVGWEPRRKCWCARIQTGGRNIHLGYFRTKEEAIIARKAAEVAYGFHPNHGRAAIEQAERDVAEIMDKLEAMTMGQRERAA